MITRKKDTKKNIKLSSHFGTKIFIYKTLMYLNWVAKIAIMIISEDK